MSMTITSGLGTVALGEELTKKIAEQAAKYLSAEEQRKFNAQTFHSFITAKCSRPRGKQ